jgi:hypothetical protein
MAQATAEEAEAEARLEAEMEAKLAEMHAQEQARRLNKGFQQSTRAHDSRVADTGGGANTKTTTGVSWAHAFHVQLVMILCSRFRCGRSAPGVQQRRAGCR